MDFIEGILNIDIHALTIDNKRVTLHNLLTTNMFQTYQYYEFNVLLRANKIDMESANKLKDHITIIKSNNDFIHFKINCNTFKNRITILNLFLFQCFQQLYGKKNIKTIIDGFVQENGFNDITSLVNFNYFNKINEFYNFIKLKDNIDMFFIYDNQILLEFLISKACYKGFEFIKNVETVITSAKNYNQRKKLYLVYFNIYQNRIFYQNMYDQAKNQTNDAIASLINYDNIANETNILLINIFHKYGYTCHYTLVSLIIFQYKEQMKCLKKSKFKETLPNDIYDDLQFK
jgi:hypothetical protein